MIQLKIYTLTYKIIPLKIDVLTNDFMIQANDRSTGNDSVIQTNNRFTGKGFVIQANKCTGNSFVILANNRYSGNDFAIPIQLNVCRIWLHLITDVS